MKNDILQLDKKFADDFWLLRKELFKELGEISEYMDASEIELATKQYFLSHINRDLISWGISNRENWLQSVLYVYLPVFRIRKI